MKNLEDAKKALKVEVIENLLDHVEEYDEQYGELEGQRVDKTFYRVDSKYLQPLIDEIQNNPNCGYVTYMNDSIKEGVVPNHISCLLKQLSEHDHGGEIVRDRDICSDTGVDKIGDYGEVRAFREVLASQILNYFGCPTAYNAIVKIKDEANEDEYKIISADFLSAEKIFTTFDEYSCTMDHGLSYMIDRIKNKILKRIKTVNDEEKNKFIEQFIKSYLVRQYIINDSDFFHTNIGQIVDPYNHEITLLNFDFENSFGDYRKSAHNLKLKMEDFICDIEYVEKRYPKIYADFKKDLTTIKQAFNEMIRSGEIDFDRSNILPDFDYAIDFSSAKGHIYCEIFNVMCRLDDAFKRMGMENLP